MSLALRGGPGAFLLEKWYVDVITDEGAVLVVYLGGVRVLGLPVARVSAEWFDGDGSRRGAAAVARGVHGSDSRLSFGPARLEDDTLSWRLPGLSGELRFRPRQPQVTPREPLLEAGGGVVTWTVEVPDADVEGWLSWPGGQRVLRGRGYRDRVFFDLPPWRLPLRRLEWGRAAWGAHAATWVRATRREGTAVSAAWRDGRLDPPEGWRPALAPARLLAGAPVAEQAVLGRGWLGPLLRRLARGPRAWKELARAEGPDGEGWALLERVEWP